MLVSQPVSLDVMPICGSRSHFDTLAVILSDEKMEMSFTSAARTNLQFSAGCLPVQEKQLTLLSVSASW